MGFKKDRYTPANTPLAPAASESEVDVLKEKAGDTLQRVLSTKEFMGGIMENTKVVNEALKDIEVAMDNTVEAVENQMDIAIPAEFGAQRTSFILEAGGHIDITAAVLLAEIAQELIIAVDPLVCKGVVLI